MEIVHDLAPEAELAFSPADSSLEMVKAILWLANDAFEGEGADVIVDDLGYFREPFFEDGIVRPGSRRRRGWRRRVRLGRR